MSHVPKECDHNWTSWTTEEAVNGAGDPEYIFLRRCTLCHKVQTEHGAIVEPR